MTFTEPKSDLPKVSSIGDQAFLVIFGESYSEQTNSRVLEFDRKLAQKEIPWIIEVVPAIRSLLIRVDPLVVEMDKVEAFINDLLDTPPDDSNKNNARQFEIPVSYGGTYGPDLENVAFQSGLSIGDLIELHSSCNLRVACLGFSPGLAYLAELTREFNLPRKESYNSTALPGSILVANRQTVFTATEIPTGWSIIGRSPVIGFRLDRLPHFLLQPGDKVRFYPIPEEDFSNYDCSQIWDSNGLG